MVAVKRGILVLGCAVAFAAAPLVVASPAAADSTCPWGTKPTHFDGVCISGGGGGAAAPIPPVPPSGPGLNINPNGVGSVNGIPCTAEHYGLCQAMIQNGS